MKTRIFKVFLCLAMGGLLAGCAAMTAHEESLKFSPATMPDGQYTAKVDNVQFILDASSTMARSGDKNLITAKNLISAINQSLPADLNFDAGLRTFGYPTRTSNKSTDLLYGMTEYTRAGLQTGLDNVTYAGGTSNLPKAIEAAGEDLRSAPGKSALIIVSDGLIESSMSGAPAALAKLKADRGDNLCTYTIAVGSNPAGEKFLQEVAQADGCGISQSAAALTSSATLGSFVKNVFLDQKKIAAAPAPKPKPKPKPEPKVVVPAPRDSDGDGVLDSRDKCPDTPKGVIVDEDGCALKLTLQINFDFDKSEIKPEFAPDLKRAADFILKYKDIPHILVAGFTDSDGDEAYNQKLSERRATAVKQYLVDRFDIAAERMVTQGKGESRPVADNSTAAGRAKNRRVELICCSVIPSNW